MCHCTTQHPRPPDPAGLDLSGVQMDTFQLSLAPFWEQKASLVTIQDPQSLCKSSMRRRRGHLPRHWQNPCQRGMNGQAVAAQGLGHHAKQQGARKTSEVGVKDTEPWHENQPFFPRIFIPIPS